MVRLGLGELYDLHMPIEEVITKIEAVTAAEVQGVAEGLFSRPLSLTAIGLERRPQGLEELLT